MPTEPILKFPQEDKVHWFLRPYSPEGNKAGRSEISAGSGNHDPAQPQLAHRPAISIKQERADPVTQIGLSLETDS